MKTKIMRRGKRQIDPPVVEKPVERKRRIRKPKVETVLPVETEVINTETVTKTEE
jgi:hypothetical protein